MEKFQKLTEDEKGQLHGGFSLHSLEKIGKTYLNNNNTNCSNDGDKNSNVNCFCPSCGQTVPPPDEPIGPGKS